MRFDKNYGSDPNYVGSSLKPTRFYQELKRCDPKSLSLFTEHEKWVAEVCTFTSQCTDDDFVQPAALWDIIGREPGHQERTIGNLAAHIKGVNSPKLRKEVYGMYSERHYTGAVLTSWQPCSDASTRILDNCFTRQPRPRFHLKEFGSGNVPTETLSRFDAMQTVFRVDGLLRGDYHAKDGCRTTDGCRRKY